MTATGLRALLCVATLCAATAAQGGCAVDDAVPHLRLRDRAGALHDAAPASGALVLVWFHTACPVARASLPEVVALARDLAPQGVAVWLVNAHDEDPAAIARFVDERAPSLPLRFDADGAAARALGVSRVPTALVVDPARRLRYRGRVFERYTGRDEGAPTIGRLDLRAAAAEVAAGKPVTVRETKAVGCLVPPAPESRPRTPLTYRADVAPILARRCVDCHHADGPGSMPLTTFAEVRPYVRDVAEVAWDMMMPPWREDGHGLKLRGERRLTDAERNTIVRWVQGGAPEGAGAVPAATSRPAAPARADADATTFDAFDVPAFGAPYEADFVFQLPPSAAGDGVLGLAATTDALETVKRVVLRRARDGALLGVSTAEGPALELPYDGNGPARHAWRCPSGEAFRATATVRPNGVPTKVRLTVRRLAAPTDASTVEPRTLRLSPESLTIPAGDARATVVVERKLDAAARLVALLPDLRHLGTEAHVVARLPDGRTKRLAGTSFWDPRLRQLWAPEAAFDLPAGTSLTFTARYDNSAENRRNPATPPVLVRGGPGPLDETCALEVVLIGP